jgi:hypothetical protein
MLKLALRSGFLGLAGATVLAALLSSPAAADPVYSWRTEDGGYAFTDDPKSIPPRYRDQAKLRETARLHDYKRYTPSDDKAAARYAEQLDRRLDHLRRLNAEPVAPSSGAPMVAGAQLGPTVTMQSANDFEPSVEVASGGQSEEPVVVETLFTRPEGKMVTRQSVVVRQGDKTLAIVKNRLREWNVADDIHDEAELAR